MQFGEEWNLKSPVLKKFEEFGLRAKPLRKTGKEEELTSKSEVYLTRLSPCHSALKPHLQWVYHRVALSKRADESILENPNPYDDGHGKGLRMECWNRCGPAVLLYQTHLLISWTLGIIKM